ncbi:MAG TPA: hypothetical protein VN282_24330 [Pyrinomonadaceae bacterium]|nr:hypothetical protein [Pyrinomonadaceae bacterium]
MAHQVIDIPGGSTMFDAAPSVRVEGAEDEPVTLVVKYRSKWIVPGEAPAFGLITFTDVIEYRFVATFFGYEDHAGHESDFRFGLIEIVNSAYVENMASKGARRKHAGQRFGEVIKESEVKHYRLAFDEYGKFDVIALGVSVSEVAG